LRPLAGMRSVYRLSRNRRPCRRCGQSHWPQPAAGDPKGFVLRHPAGEGRAGRRPLFSVDDKCTVADFCPHAAGLVGMSLFDRPKRTEKAAPTGTSSLRARRRAVRAAADGSAPRGGRESEGPVGLSRDSLGHLRWPHSNTDSRRGAEGHTLVVPLCSAAQSETPHRERPRKRIGERTRGKEAGGTAIFSILR
jgi:hypothetical protein